MLDPTDISYAVSFDHMACMELNKIVLDHSTLFICIYDHMDITQSRLVPLTFRLEIEYT